MESLALAFTSGTASGVNAYLVVLMLGVAERLGVDGIPHVLGRWEVLAAAGVFYGFEFVADKIPYVDSTWDAVSTVIRPAVGATLGALIAQAAGDTSSTVDTVVAGVLGGGTALSAHSVKSGSRLALNLSPEPFTNVIASVVEDLGVFGVMLLAIAVPVLAAVVAGVLLLVGIVVLYLAIRVVRAGWTTWKARRATSPAAI